MKRRTKQTYNRNKFVRECGFKPLRRYDESQLTNVYVSLSKSKDDIPHLVDYLMRELKDDWGHWHTDKEQWTHMRHIFTLVMIKHEGYKHLFNEPVWKDYIKMAISVVKGIEAKKKMEAALFRQIAGI